MSHRLHSVALLPTGVLAQRLDGIRRVLADPRLFDLPSHLTLVPPVRLNAATLGEAAAALRSAASGARPLDLSIGRADSFAPLTRTVHLRVDGDVQALAELRDRLLVGPFARPDRHDFVPHVTLRQRVEAADLAPVLELLSGVVGEWHVDSLFLLERQETEHGRRWVPVREEPLGGPGVVGRGGVELHLRNLRIIEPEALELLDSSGAVERESLERLGDPVVDRLLVVAAHHRASPGVAIVGHAPVGVAVGLAGRSGALLEAVAVQPDMRGVGVGRRVVNQWCRVAAELGAPSATVHVREPGNIEVASRAAAAFGFRAAGPRTWCREVASPRPFDTSSGRSDPGGTR